MGEPIQTVQRPLLDEKGPVWQMQVVQILPREWHAPSRRPRQPDPLPLRTTVAYLPYHLGLQDMKITFLSIEMLYKTPITSKDAFPLRQQLPYSQPLPIPESWISLICLHI